MYVKERHRPPKGECIMLEMYVWVKADDSLLEMYVNGAQQLVENGCERRVKNVGEQSAGEMYAK